MNVANLQIEGLMMAVASLNQMLVQKGVATVAEIDTALHKAEASLTSEDHLAEDMKPVQRDAVVFPIRLLRLANNSQDSSDVIPFSELARMVGETKHSYNDEM